MSQQGGKGVPWENLPMSAMLKDKVNRAGFYRLREGRNRKERRRIEKLNKQK